MANKTSQAAIARAWGLSSARITQYKNRGMPVDSVEAAFNWLSVNHPERATEIAGFNKGLDGIDAVEKPNEPGDDELKGNGPAVVVARLCKSEATAWEYLKAAIEKKQVASALSLFKHYRDCGEARLDAEKSLLEYQVRTRELAPVVETNQFVAKLLGTIETQLQALPFACCSQANPADPELARTAVELSVRKMRSEIRDAVEAMND